MNPIQAIPTTYKGINMRSRLEARWAEVFDLLRWPWTYEPFELKGYIPDFVVSFEHFGDMVVEIKPFLRLDEYLWQPVMNKIDASGWIGGYSVDEEPIGPSEACEHCYFRELEPSRFPACQGDCDARMPLAERPALILGARIWPSESNWNEHSIVGYIRDDSIWSGGGWGKANILKCRNCGGVFPYQEDSERSCRRCGSDDKHYGEHAFPIEDYFNHAKNNHQWKHK